MEKGVLFDLDGTLWDSSKEVLLCWQKELRALGYAPTQKEIEGLMGLTPKEIALKMFPVLPLEEALALTYRCMEAENEYLWNRGAALYPGVPETLSALKESYALCIVSNCGKGYIEAFLHAHGLGGLFAGFECAGNTGLDKGSNILLLMEKLKLREAVFVGDTDSDRAAAAKAGIPFIYASWGFGKLSALREAPSFSALKALVASILSQ